MNTVNVRRAAIFVIVLGALAAWIAAAATSGVRDTRPIAQTAPPAIDASGEALAAEIARLHDRLRPTTSPRLGRDLFQFVAARPPVAQAVQALPEAPAAPAPEPAPAITLVGIAQDSPETGAARTAIISTPSQLFLAKEGDDVTSGSVRYRVRKISADAAELVAADQTILRLALK